MSNAPWLTLIVPGIGAALVHDVPTAQHGTQLARLAGRGSLQHAWSRHDRASAGLRPWQRGLLAALELPESGFPSAAVSASAAGPQSGSRQWLHAEPIHFIAGLDRLTFVALNGAAGVTDTELAALQPVLAEHLASWNCELQPAGASWLISAGRAFEAATVCPEAAAATELGEVMPTGRDSGQLRRLMTELQMLLHDHPVNAARECRALPAINAVWLWGTGAVAQVQPAKRLPLALGAEPYLRGIYCLHDQSVQSSPANCGELLSRISATQRAIAVVSATATDGFESQWIEPLARALTTRVIDRLDVIMDDWHLDVTRASLLRFWRRPKPPAQWPAGEWTENSKPTSVLEKAV